MQFEHTWPAVHACPQEPQFLLDVWVSMHSRPQSVWPVGQLATQVPPTQTWLASHFVPQAPQLSGCVVRSAQPSPQTLRPFAHVPPSGKSKATGSGPPVPPPDPPPEPPPVAWPPPVPESGLLAGPEQAITTAHNEATRLLRNMMWAPRRKRALNRPETAALYQQRAWGEVIDRYRTTTPGVTATPASVGRALAPVPRRLTLAIGLRMNRLLTLVALSLLAGCATLKSRAADAMACPVAEVEEQSPSANDVETGRALARLMTPLYVTSYEVARQPGERRAFKGCGLTVACDREGCFETEGSRAHRLSLVVPALMRESQRQVADATTERTGVFSWQLNSPSKGTTECHAVAGGSYHCQPEL
jgi:hypothetical protein